MSEPSQAILADDRVPRHAPAAGARYTSATARLILDLAIYDDLDAVETDWRRFERSADCTVFQAFDWLALWHRHIGRRLDVSLLQENLITPVLGIDDPRRDKRIDFVGGIRGLKELERRVESGEMACAFSLYPTSMADLMSVADAGEVMPPKSTWFEPKLADGLVSHVLD